MTPELIARVPEFWTLKNTFRDLPVRLHYCEDYSMDCIARELAQQFFVPYLVIKSLEYLVVWSFGCILFFRASLIL